mmetsp:Transcript_57217/g.167446  ORF Transcript_57217/g.167446 Transcript_57217/m.167446 type:complete len:260 (-) Transcript_57217:1309-2088(-)
MVSVKLHVLVLRVKDGLHCFLQVAPHVHVGLISSQCCSTSAKDGVEEGDHGYRHHCVGDGVVRECGVECVVIAAPQDAHGAEVGHEEPAVTVINGIEVDEEGQEQPQEVEDASQEVAPPNTSANDRVDEDPRHRAQDHGLQSLGVLLDGGSGVPHEEQGRGHGNARVLAPDHVGVAVIAQDEAHEDPQGRPAHVDEVVRVEEHAAVEDAPEADGLLDLGQVLGVPVLLDLEQILRELDGEPAQGAEVVAEGVLVQKPFA